MNPEQEAVKQALTNGAARHKEDTMNETARDYELPEQPQTEIPAAGERLIHALDALDGTVSAILTRLDAGGVLKPLGPHAAGDEPEAPVEAPLARMLVMQAAKAEGLDSALRSVLHRLEL